MPIKSSLQEMEKLKEDFGATEKLENVSPRDASPKPALPARPKNPSEDAAGMLQVAELNQPELPQRPVGGIDKHLGLPAGLWQDEQKQHLQLSKLEESASSALHRRSQTEPIEKPELPPRPAYDNLDQESSKDPPSLSEEDLVRAQEQHEQALNDLDLDASGTSTPIELTDDETLAEDPGSPNRPSRRETFKKAYATAAPKVRTAYETSRHFAGGLIAHPVQSNKRFSVLRHSHGLVAYRGHRTSVAITVFADDIFRLPPDRTIWLQPRGWSGQKGMNFKTKFGRTKTWHNVTPQAYVGAEQVRPADEKAWQRDIEAFTRKARQKEKFARRQLLETCVIRIPVAATDGYFRLLVCDAEKNVLCPSPVFRVVSLSTSSASFKGASLSTLPLEIGIKGLTTFAFSAASSGAAPLASVIQNRFGTVTSAVLSRGMNAAFSAMEKAALSDNARARYEAARDAGAGNMQSDAYEQPIVIGHDEGPEIPYPLRFSGKVVHGAGKSNIETGLPTANLSGVRDEIKTGLNGIYFGWASIQDSKTIVSKEWRPALVFARPSESGSGVAPKKVLRVFVIEDFDGVDFFDARLLVIVMGPLRTWSETHPDQFRQETAVDILIARQSLERPAWQAEATIQRLKRQTSLAGQLANTKQMGQRQFDRIPFDKLSIRTPMLEIKDAAIGKGGLCIDRRPSAAPQ